jgi:hypothetical protein
VSPDNKTVIVTNPGAEHFTANARVTGVPGSGPRPNALRLRQNYPNPFRSETHIAFTLPGAGAVSLDVFDVSGRRVANLVRGVLPAGTHVVPWRGASNRLLHAGIYFCRLEWNGRSQTQRMVLLR